MEKWKLLFRVWGSRILEGLGLNLECQEDLGSRLGFRVQGLRFRVKGLGFRV